MAAIFTIFILSFTVALSGALTPGPLLTYTIVKTLNDQKRGYLVGAWVVLGHAFLEVLIIVILLAGFSLILKNNFSVKVIGTLGGGFLIFLGMMLLRDVFIKKVELPQAVNREDNKNHNHINKKTLISNPVIGGILVSMSNPFWWVWWATIGFAFMVQYKVSLANVPGLIAFFLGHELGDLVWYMFVSVMMFWGRSLMNRIIYHIILIICALFLIGFGLFLGISVLFYE